MIKVETVFYVWYDPQVNEIYTLKRLAHIRAEILMAPLCGWEYLGEL